MHFLNKSEGSLVVPSHYSSASPRVAFFLPHLGGGGTEKMVVTLANGLASRGCVVDMVLVRAVGVYRRALLESIQVVDLNAINSYFSVLGLAAYLRERQPQVLVSSLNVTNLLAVVARWLSGSESQVAIRIENTISVQRHVRWKKEVEKILLAWLYPRADKIIAVSRAVAVDAAQYIGLAPARIDVIYNPVISAEHSANGVDGPTHPWFAEGIPPCSFGCGPLNCAKGFCHIVEGIRPYPSRKACSSHDTGRREPAR